MAYVYVQIAFGLLLVGAVAAGLMRSWKSAGWVATAFVGAATVSAWAVGLPTLLKGQVVQGFALRMPVVGELAVSLDPLGAAFLLLITGVCLLATIYSIGYMTIYKTESPGRFYFLLQLFISGMVGVVCVADWLFFLVFWEIMTLASYFLVTYERGNASAIRAGLKYFIMTHVATAGLLATVIVLWGVTGSFTFSAHKEGLALVSPALKQLLLALYLIAFSTKAGIFPMGDWLPDAHPAAPSGISAILSGVMIKLGAYGVLRVFWGVLPDIGVKGELIVWGVVIAVLGTVSAVVGGLTAMKENDSKRLLAFSSISQAGYIFLALGIGITFASSDKLASLALLGMLAAGFHILNDAIYKSLLFMNAGSILYSTGTRDLNKVGGLSSVMPIAAVAGLVGIASLAGLPPTNGFASKWLIYQSSISGGLQFAPFLAIAVVAFFVSLSTLAYSLKYYNTAFLGKPADETIRPVPIPATMTFAQSVLALACIVIGLVPVLAIRLIASVFNAVPTQAFEIGGSGGLATIPAGGVMPAFWNPLILFGIFLVCILIGEAIRRSGHGNVRVVPSWYGGEEHLDDEVRFRAQGFYSPFNKAFEKMYPHLPFPRLPSISKLKSVLDLDSWLYNPLLRSGGNAVDKVSRSHVGIPQLYMIWQVAGMIIVLVLLFVLIR